MNQNFRFLNKTKQNFLKFSNKKISTSQFEDLENKIHKNNIKTVTMGFPDLYGRFMGKKFDSDYFLNVFTHLKLENNQIRISSL